MLVGNESKSSKINYQGSIEISLEEIKCDYLCEMYLLHFLSIIIITILPNYR